MSEKIKASNWGMYTKYMNEKYDSAPFNFRPIMVDKAIFGSKRPKCIGEEICFGSVTVPNMEAFDKMRQDLIDLGMVRLRYSGAQTLKNGDLFFAWVFVTYVTKAMRKNLETYQIRTNEPYGYFSNGL